MARRNGKAEAAWARSLELVHGLAGFRLDFDHFLVFFDPFKIKISGFGNFVVRAKRGRIGRNPRTNAPMPISARRVLTFRPSPKLKEALNPGATFDAREEG